MDPRILAVLTIFAVGIICFLIGLLITSSKWKRKYKTAQNENALLSKQNIALNSRVAQLEQDERKAVESYEQALAENQEMQAEMTILNNKNSSLRKKIKELQNTDSTAELERLKQVAAKEKKRRIELEEGIDRLTKPNPVKGKNMAIQTNANADVQAGTRQSLTYRLTNIFNKIGLKDPNQEDDLTEINGIGEEISKKMNKIGIYNFKQIAQLQEADLNVIDEALEFFPGRALRDDWIGQAKNLQRRKPA